MFAQRKNCRYVGGYIPLDVFEAFEAARGERGIGSRTEALAEAITYWVTMHPPATGVHRTIAETLRLVSLSRAARSALDAAISEWRVSKREDLLTFIIQLAADAGLELPADVLNATSRGTK